MKIFIFVIFLVLFGACSIVGSTANNNVKTEKSLLVSNFNKSNILDSECQKRRFSQNDTIRWIGNEGTQIIIYPKSFNSEDDTLTILLKECYNVSDMIKYNLQTLTDKDEVLQTKGMIYLKVLNNEGNEVLLKEGMPIHIIFSATKVDSDYMIYDGIVKNNSINWGNPSKRIDKFSPIFFPIPKEGDEGYDLYKKDEILYVEYLSMKKYGASNLELDIFEVRNLGWKNLDKLWEGNTFVTLKIEVEQQFENGNLYSLYPDDKILLEFRKVNNNFISDRIIANKKHLLLLIVEVNGDTYYQLVKDSYSSQNKFLKFNQLVRCENIKELLETQISW